MRTLHKSGTLLAMALLVAVGGVTGCNALRAGGARHKYVNDQTKEYVYKKPITEVWPNVRTLLFDQGFQTKSSDSGGSYSLETEPKTESGETTRILAQGVKIDDGSCRIEIIRNISSSTRKHSERDLEIEWALLQKVDPAGAKDIDTRADAAGEAAKKP
jgi:hypothetical protein